MAARRWMVFVDGENFTLRAQEYAKRNDLTLKDGPLYFRDVFVWIPELSPMFPVFPPQFFAAETHAIRAHYYTSAQGDDAKRNDIRRALRALTFEPMVVQRRTGQSKSKGVDIALTTDVLSHTDNYDFAVLIAGDADYLPLIREVKRRGKLVCVVFFEGDGLGLSEELKLEADHFTSVNQLFYSRWSEHARKGR